MAFSQDKVVIEVGVNEGQLRSANPHVPYSPEEIAADAQRCYDAGAAVIHYHGREAGTGANRSNDPSVNIATQRAITEATPLIAYPTYASHNPIMDAYYDIGGPAPERYRHFVEGVQTNVKFEIGPVDLGAALDVNAYKNPATGEWTLSKGHQINTGEDHKWLTEFCLAHALKMSFAVFDTVHLQNLRNIVDMGWVKQSPLLVKLFYLGDTAGPKSLIYSLDRLHDLFPDMTTRWMPVVYGADQFPMCTLALGLGGHVRVGIGDYHYAEHLNAGKGQPGNADLVERIVAVARAMGREPATPDEAREIQGIYAAKEGKQ